MQSSGERKYVSVHSESPRDSLHVLSGLTEISHNLLEQSKHTEMISTTTTSLIYSDIWVSKYQGGQKIMCVVWWGIKIEFNHKLC